MPKVTPKGNTRCAKGKGKGAQETEKRRLTVSVRASSHGRYIRRYEKEIISRVKCLEKIEWTSKGGAWTNFLEKPYLYKKDIVIIICGGKELTKL